MRWIKTKRFEKLWTSSLCLSLASIFILHSMAVHCFQVLAIPLAKRTGPLEKQCQRLKKMKIYLDSSLMKLDDAIMLFHDFWLLFFCLPTLLSFLILNYILFCAICKLLTSLFYLSCLLHLWAINSEKNSQMRTADNVIKS